MSTLELATLRRENAELKVWQQVAIDANIALESYLREVYPALPLYYGMPVDGVRHVVNHLCTEMDS